MTDLLLIKTSSLGDVVHAFPAVTDMARHCPTLSIDWIVEESFAALPRLHPAVRRVIPVALRRWRTALFAPTTHAEWRRLSQVLEALNHDASLDLQGLVKSALVGCFSPALRMGYDRHSIREPLASLFYQQHFRVSRNLHAVERNRTLAGLALGYAPEKEVTYGLRSDLVRPRTLSAIPYVLFLHGTSRRDKEWPETHWIALGRQLSAQGLTILLPGGNERERKRAQRLANQIVGAQALATLDLTALAGLLAHAQAVVGVDTGLSHLATALHRPVVALYTATDPQATGVFGSMLAVNLGGKGLCPEVPEVLSALERLLP
jgi:heptosyltransferase-1